MSYEDAPATKMLASHCAACSRPLVDAASVEIGLGPICRRNYIFVEDWISEEDRAEANKLIYQIALKQKGKDVNSALGRLKELGFKKLTERIIKRLDKSEIKIHYSDDRIVVKTPSTPVVGSFDELLSAIQKIPGRKWEPKLKSNSFPFTSRRSVWNLLKRFYPLATGSGPQGSFVVS